MVSYGQSWFDKGHNHPLREVGVPEALKRGICSVARSSGSFQPFLEDTTVFT